MGSHSDDRDVTTASADQREGEQRPREADERQHEQGRDCRADDRPEPERRGQSGQCRDAPAAPRLRSEIGLRRRRGRAAEAAVDRPEDREQGEGQRAADPAAEAR